MLAASLPMHSCIFHAEEPKAPAVLVLSIRFTEEQQLENLRNEKHADQAGLQSGTGETNCILRAHMHATNCPPRSYICCLCTGELGRTHLQFMLP